MRSRDAVQIDSPCHLRGIKFTSKIVIACAGWLAVSNPVQAQDVVTGAHTNFHPLTRDEIADDLHRSVTATGLPPQPYMRELPWVFPPGTPAFFRDSMLQVVARSYYLTSDNFDGSRSRAWAAGGWLGYRSGLIGDVLGVHTAFYTSQRLYGPPDESGTFLLNPEQQPLNMLGQAYARVKVLDQEFRGGRQLVDTPLINPQDNRMVPGTFTGAVLTTLPDSTRSYDYSVGYLWNFKSQDSNDFISMSDTLASGDVVNRGATFGMVKYRPFPGLSTVFMDYYVEDFVNTGFAQAEYDFQLPKDVPQWTVGVNYIDQRSVGANLLTGSYFQTYQASAKAQMSYQGWIVFAAGSIFGNSTMYSPFGGKPNYTDMQQISFDNPGEKAVGAGVVYNFTPAFGRVGLAGLTAGAWYAHGWGAYDPTTGLGIPNRDELDLWLQYRPSEGQLKGFRLRVQYANVWQQGNLRDPQPELRLITGYTVLFR